MLNTHREIDDEQRVLIHTHTQIVDSEKLIQNGRKRFHQILFAKKKRTQVSFAV